jgi:septum formation inhibitor-activating ATPase MinD
VSDEERWVVLGLAPVRAGWFTDLARWSTAGMVPVEFVKCMSVDELVALLRGGRSFSALVIDAGSIGFDRDLVADASRHGCPTIVVADGDRSFADVGASGSLPQGFDRVALLSALTQHTQKVTRVGSGGTSPPPHAPAWRGDLIVVTGSPGTGRSTLSMAIAQGLATDPRRATVALADLCLDADLALLHDAREVLPGVQELVDAHRGPPPAAGAVRQLLFHMPDRGYDLLLGLRRHRDWSALRPRAVEAALHNLRGAYRTVVAEVDPDLEGEAECGSADVEERNALARTAISGASVVVVVGRPGVQGAHRLVRVLGHLLQHGTPPERLQPVLNMAPRRRRDRAEITACVAALTTTVTGGPQAVPSPAFVPLLARLGTTVHDALPLPHAITLPPSAAVGAAIERLPRRETRPEYERVIPGSLGQWALAEDSA